MNVRQFLKDTQRRVFFKYSTDTLLYALESTREIKSRANILAELFFRKLLKADNRIENAIVKYLPDGELYFFDCNYSVDMKDLPPEKLWNKNNSSLSERTHNALVSRLEQFSRIDGFIPLILPAGQGGVFLPFYLEKKSGVPAVIDLEGKEIPEWSTYIQTITEDWQVRIEASIEDGPFTGNSLMLPVQLAIWRKENSQDFPKYNTLRLLSTGAFNSQGILIPVDVIEKIKSAKLFFSDYTFCIPESPLAEHMKEARELKLFPPQNKVLLKENIKKLIEEKNLANFSLKYAMQRQNELEQAVRFQQRNDWQCVIDRLQALSVFGKFRHRKEYLNHLMLLSAACCHAGFTQRAVEFNEQAVCYAKDNGFNSEQLQLEIENIVLLLDQEKFTVIAQIVGELEERLHKFNNNDLLMRFYGTLGQVNSYGCLANYSEFSRETGKKYFESALDFAYKKGNESDIAQDTNYLHLWYTLFFPGSQEEHEAYMEAEKQITVSLHGKSEEQFRQKNYLLRQKAFALYRNYLLTGNIPNYNQKKLALNSPDFWLKATWNKYIGSLEAAAGNMQYAKQLFDEALELLQPYKNQILAFIRMTISAQAFCSLHDHSYKDDALQMLHDNSTDLLTYHDAAQKWADCLKNEAMDKLSDLAIKYWY